MASSQRPGFFAQWGGMIQRPKRVQNHTLPGKNPEPWFHPCQVLACRVRSMTVKWTHTVSAQSGPISRHARDESACAKKGFPTERTCHTPTPRERPRDTLRHYGDTFGSNTAPTRFDAWS